MRLFLFLILFCFSSSSLAVLNSSDQTVLDIDSVSQSIWRVCNKNAERGGTGFFIGPNQFITNFHVIYSVLKDSQVEELFLFHDEFPTLKVKKVLALSALYDLALLEIKAEETPPPLNFREDISNLNKDLVMLGYPVMRGYPVGKWTQVNKISEFLPPTSESRSHFLVDYHYLSGASGSPILDNKGQVVGMHFGTTGNMSTIINLHALKRFVSGEEGQNCKDLDIKKCMRKTLDSLKKRAKQGDAIAQYELGLSSVYKKNRDIKRGYKWFKKSAQQDYFMGQLIMANMYIIQEEEIQSLNRLEKTIRRAIFYFKGEKKARDQVFNWMKEAAEQDHPVAKYTLGLMYNIMSLDKKGHRWLLESARQGYIPAQAELDYLQNRELVDIEPQVSKEKIVSPARVSSHQSLSSNEDSCFKTIKSLYPTSLKL